MCPIPPETWCAHMPKFHDPSMRNRIVKRFKLKLVVAFSKLTKWSFFSKNPLFWTFWPLNVPQTSQNVFCFKIPVPWPMHTKSDCQKVQIEAGGGHSKIDKIIIFSIIFFLVCKWSEIFTCTLLVEPLKCPQKLLECVKNTKFC